jgi:PTH1 family peptidyl-tRNA hydrolase
VKLVVGLGNPGPQYARTRHNVGFRVVARFAADHGIALDREAYRGIFGAGEARLEGHPSVRVGVLQPHTFMNRSGDAVAEAARALGLEAPGQLLVATDDVDLPFGRIRLRAKGGAGGQRGLGHIIERLGTQEFPRLRFGVGRPQGGWQTSDHVLDAFSDEEEEVLIERIARAADAITWSVCAGVPLAMNEFNRELPAEPGLRENP